MKKILYLIGPLALWALPQSPEVVNGAGSFDYGLNELNIIADDRSVIQWDAFSIAENETTRFQLPTSQSSVLNRVMTAYPSEIMGRLESNGQVLLINSNGILVGKDAMIDVGSLIASTLDMKSFDDWTFAGTSDASVIHRGTIRSQDGDVLLIAKEVVNEGSIEGGLVGLIASAEVILKPAGMDRLYVKGKNFSDAFIHDSEADALEFDDGLLKATNKGSVHAELVYVLGEQVHLTESSRIDSSGDFGGGTVLIGGDYQGMNESIPNAKYTRVEAGSVIDVSAKENGNGGKAIIWANESTGFYGTVLNKGGKEGGNGGFVEISGNYLDFQGFTDRSALKGEPGLLFLDPINITIGAADSANVINPGGPGTYTFSSCAPNPAIIGAVALENNLNTGSVTINTSAAGGAGCASAGNITVSSAVTWNGGATTGTKLTLIADHNITINAEVFENNPTAFNAGNTGGVILIAPSTGTITVGNGSVGSQNGVTFVGNPALDRCSRSRPTVIVGTGVGVAVIGINPPVTTPNVSGPIDVTCGNLTMTATFANGDAEIGHGSAYGAHQFLAATTASITVDCTNLNMSFAPGQCSIGHANFDGDYGANSAIFGGDICVTASNNITINQTVADFTFTILTIGHCARGNNPSNLSTLAGNITVKAGNNISVTFGASTGALNTSNVSFGHYATGGLANFPNNFLMGDINVSCGQNLTFTIPTTAPSFTQVANIGHQVGGSTNTVSSNISLSVGGNLTANFIQPEKVSLYLASHFIGVPINFFGSSQIAVGGNFTFTTTPGTVGFSKLLIGNNKAFPAASGANFNNTYMAVGGNLSLAADNTGGVPVFFQVESPHDLNMGVQGSANFTLNGLINGVNPNLISAGPAGILRMYSGGSILAPLSTGGTQSVNISGTSIDLEAGGSIDLVSVALATTTGFINEFVNTQFAGGAIFQGGACQLATVCKQPVLPSPFTTTGLPPVCGICSGSACTAAVSPCTCPPTCNPICKACGCSAPPFALSGNSAAVSGSGGTLVTGSVTTTSGAINLTSTCPGTNLFLGGGGVGSNMITTTSGNILVSNFSNITNNQLIHTSGSIQLIACNNIVLNQNVISTGSFCSTCAGGSTAVLPGVTVEALKDVVMVTGTNMTIGGLVESMTGNVTLVMDNQFPRAPLFGLNTTFTLSATGTVSATAGKLRIFSALQNNTSILGKLIGPLGLATPFVPGALFTNTTQETWCTYYPGSCPFANLAGFLFGPNFMVFYKNCLQQATSQAMVVVTEFLVDLHPYNEFPGWMEEFFVKYVPSKQLRSGILSSVNYLPQETFYLRRRHLNVINHPKTWTNLEAETDTK